MQDATPGFAQCSGLDAMSESKIDAGFKAKLRMPSSERLAADRTERILARDWNDTVLADAAILIRIVVPHDDTEQARLPGTPLRPRRPATLQGDL